MSHGVIIVHGTIPVKEESRDEALDLARTMAAATRTEPGCLSYDFYVGLTEPNKLMLFQEWETMEALMEHFKTDHMEAFLRELPDLLDGEITTRRYAVQVVPDNAEDNAEESADETYTEDAEQPPVIH